MAGWQHASPLSSMESAQTEHRALQTGVMGGGGVEGLWVCMIGGGTVGQGVMAPPSY